LPWSSASLIFAPPSTTSHCTLARSPIAIISPGHVRGASAKGGAGKSM
jgi:hypothetical protein